MSRQSGGGEKSNRVVPAQAGTHNAVPLESPHGFPPARERLCLSIVHTYTKGAHSNRIGARAAAGGSIPFALMVRKLMS